ncbi:ABC transporter permease [Confluentibacter sediminis]|uniref:ABC transporter permease n=1 Tax=Confluentibacter sediminis TaxID=2219045 RepID=UPI000DAB705F|nr:ABC transporter permease [Confluentibacter sediminis]
MIKNYFKIAWRNLWKNKVFSSINIVGLAIGMASTILIMLWIQNEVSHDRFHKNLERIYTLNNRDTFNGELWVWNTTPKILAPTLKEEFPEVEEFTRVNSSPFLFAVGDMRIDVEGKFVDPGFLKLFSFPFKEGNINTALNETYNIVITESLAKKLFGNDEAMGKVIKIVGRDNFTVTGVVKDLPNNTSLDFEFLLPWSYMKVLGWDDEWWGNNSIKSFVMLKPGVKQDVFDSKIKNVTKEHSKNTGDLSTIEVFTQPLKDTWLYSKSENGKYVGSRIETVKLFAIVAVFILLIACINFMNLSTARSEKRAREVGIRKVVGARRESLMFQFISESIILSFLAFVIAIGIVELSLPGFNRLVAKDLFVDYGHVVYWLVALLFILFTGILAGSYPAFYLSAFKPIKVLKQTFKSGNTLVTPRKVLVVLQFTFAIALIICTVTIKKQIEHAQSRDSGYNKDNLVYMHIVGDIDKHYSVIRNELLNSGAAISVTKSMSPITTRYSDGWGWEWDGSNEGDSKTDFVRMASDADFVKTMGANLVAGRDIDIYKYSTDSTAMVLNETAVKIMRLEHPIGASVRADGETWRVVGVIKDFIYESPYDKVQQLAIMGPKSWFGVLHLKLNPANAISKNIGLAEAIFKKYNPEFPFDFEFVDTDYALKFQEEKRIGTLAGLFSALTIFISCLGLFGLASYMAENRIKEIGVRKVLGASVANITTLLSLDFLKLVVISLLIASPIAWWAMENWLQKYTYRIDMEWWVFALAGGVSILVSMITVSYQSIRAAIANPVKSLRTE